MARGGSVGCGRSMDRSRCLSFFFPLVCWPRLFGSDRLVGNLGAGRRKDAVCTSNRMALPTTVGLPRRTERRRMLGVARSSKERAQRGDGMEQNTERAQAQQHRTFEPTTRSDARPINCALSTCDSFSLALTYICYFAFLRPNFSLSTNNNKKEKGEAQEQKGVFYAPRDK